MGVRDFVQRLDIGFRIIPEPILEVVDVHGGEKGSEVDDVGCRTLKLLREDRGMGDGHKTNSPGSSSKC